jgi:phosphoadenosine phosphosulfate reductase
MELHTKIQLSIELLQKAESLALKYQEYGFHLAFSGGKDSITVYELCKMAKVKFKSIMNITTLDPPELMQFVRENYPDLIYERPEINFYKLIVERKMLPTMKARYCCHYLKEQSGVGAVVVLGIRKAEGRKRSKRNEFEIGNRKYSDTLDQFNIDNENQLVCIKGKDKIMLSPIINWTDSDVWNFIRKRKLKFCKLYSEGYNRIGCMFCPMSSAKSIQRDRVRYPGVEKQIKKSIEQLCKNSDHYKIFDNDVDEIFEWWISKLSQETYLKRKSYPKMF